jgi:endo-1,4-beta-xylanase
MLLVCLALGALPLCAQDTLRALAETKGKLIGAAVKRNFISQPASMSGDYRDALAREFNVLVAENSFKMESLLTKRPADPFRIQVSDLNTAPIDRLMERARQNGGQKIRGHALIWHRQAPEWLESESRPWSSSQITSFATSYITAVLTYCKTNAPLIYEWDVVNEAIDGDPAHWRKGTWYEGVTSKQDFLDDCFRAARAADPKVRLIYNDYSIELRDGESKSAFLLDMVAGMVARRVPIDGVGLQCHFTGPDATGAGGFTEKKAQDFARTFEKLREIGLDGIVTELDIALPTDRKNAEGKVTPRQLEAQGRQYELIVFTALSQPNCPALLTWGFTDAHSWIPKFQPGKGHALLLDHAYRKKPAYHGVARALEKLK